MKPFKRTGTHRLECPACPFYVYATVAALEAHGLPSCPCGHAVEPERLELALLLELSTPVVLEYRRRADRKVRAQRPHATHRLSGELESMELRAYDEIRTEQAAIARNRRLAALKPAPEALPF